MILSETLSLLIVVSAAAMLPLLGRRLNLPNAVLEILLGVLLGRSLLNLQISGEWLPFLAKMGFLILMFHAGLEIDFAALRKQSRNHLMIQVAVAAATLGLSWWLARMMGMGLFMALVLSTTSLGLVLPILKEFGISRTPLGQTVLMAATLADFSTLLGITFFLLWRRYGVGLHFILPFLLFLGFGVLLRLVWLWAWWNPNKVEFLIGRQDPHELGIRFSLALLFLCVALSEFVHLEPVLGAFLGGCVLSAVFKEIGYLETKLSALGFGFLIPIFFIHVGMNLELGDVLDWKQLVFTLQILGVAFVVKIIPSLLFIFQGISFRWAVQAGILLSTRLSLIVAAAAIGVNEGFLTSQMKDTIVLLALLTCIIGPTVFKFGARDLKMPGLTARSG